MTRYVVDTNVPIVANGRPYLNDQKIPSVGCRTAAVQFLLSILASGKILLDFAGEIEGEYRRHLNPKGEPGVGDRFYLEVHNSSPSLVERVEVPKRADGEYADLPQALVDANFDPSDRKFAALAKGQNAPVANATDSDWLDHRATLTGNGIQIEFLCGCDKANWFCE